MQGFTRRSAAVLLGGSRGGVAALFSSLGAPKAPPPHHVKETVISTCTADKAPPGLDALDKIHLRGLVFHGYHGAVSEENVYGQKFVVDAILYCNLRAAGISDNLHDTVNYAEVYRLVKGVMEGPYHLLLESLGERLANEVIAQQPLVQGVCVHIKKPQVHLEGIMDSVGVELTRFRGPG